MTCTLKRNAATMLAAAVAIVTLYSSAMAAEPEGQPRQWQFNRPWTVYLLAHSHNDIGYTHPQSEVERKQWQNIDMALELCRKTADYPAGARFKWNVEVLWAVDSYLREAPPEKQQRLIEAVRAGQIELDALYGNELTGLCRPEELFRLCECSQRLSKRCGVKIDTAMISDVPGYTWGLVPAMAEAGVKYFSIGSNGGDRIGRMLSTWAEKPFYWAAPDGCRKILCWVPYHGYSLACGRPLIPTVPDHVADLERANYPYDIIQLRWCFGGDNGPPDATLSETVKNWNAKHDSPKFIIATASEAFRAFEQRYGDKVPTFSGDWTPYWEDGASSTSRETSLNRTAAERLAQAEALWAILDPRWYPVDAFSTAWRNVMLYDEHTWGAWNSISDPDNSFVKEQWKYKQGFAAGGDSQSRELLVSALARNAAQDPVGGVDVFNTSSWPRTDLVVLSKDQSDAGDLVLDSDGKPVPSQRLSTRELAFVAKNIPPLAGRRFTIAPEHGLTAGQATVAGTTLANSAVKIELDPDSGAVTSLRGAGVDAELCDAKSGVAINRYYYVLADRVSEARQSGLARITVKERGPLVASLVVESGAPGCEKFTREFRVVEGLNHVEIVNVLDKRAVRAKEGVHLGFAFNVPDGVMRMDIPWAVVRPEADQLPGACKNWFTVGRWIDVSNRDYGVTWATLDAPMVEVGAITADKIGGQNNPDVWLDKIAPSQTFYSYAMNNYWYTNYKADQEGPTAFRYALLPHRRYDAAAAQRFGIERSQPLVVAPARGAAPSGRPLVELDTPDAIIATLKPSADRKAWIVRLFGAAGRPVEVGLRWGAAAPKAVCLSNLAEDQGEAVTGKVHVPAWGVVTLRAEMPDLGN